ncbi:hypothetical protein PoB_004769500 [Plakobranchus ocellatus]|uniref:Uncharacterized protein n=1 Tax=Plakobranchus ocellatus TaxID=259542 RepID=A0AAV4BKZ4_9GAST|nr:hypothetical protein PoB_004769500 [Plakobranchus ocellatus]
MVKVDCLRKRHREGRGKDAQQDFPHSRMADLSGDGGVTQFDPAATEDDNDDDDFVDVGADVINTAPRCPSSDNLSYAMAVSFLVQTPTLLRVRLTSGKNRVKRVTDIQATHANDITIQGPNSAADLLTVILIPQRKRPLSYHADVETNIRDLSCQVGCCREISLWLH